MFDLYKVGAEWLFPQCFASRGRAKHVQSKYALHTSSALSIAFMLENPPLQHGSHA